MTRLGLLSALPFTVVFILSTAQVSALVTVPDSTDKRPDIIPIDTCQIIQNRIAQQIEKIDDRVSSKQQRYREIQVKIERIIVIAQEHGVETTQLKHYAHTLELKVDNFAREAHELVAILKKTHTLACGGDKKAFYDALGTARSQLAIVRGAAADIRLFIADKLVHEARAVLGQL